MHRCQQQVLMLLCCHDECRCQYGSEEWVQGLGKGDQVVVLCVYMHACVCVYVHLHSRVSACDKSGPSVSWAVLCEDGVERSGKAGTYISNMHVLLEDLDYVWMVIMEESVGHARFSCGGQTRAGVRHDMGL